MKTLFMFKSENFLAPIGLCAISAVAKKEGHNTYLCEINSQNPLKMIDELNPEIIAYSSSTGESKHYFRLNSQIKKEYPGSFTIMGGPCPTFDNSVINEGDLDAICVGEGEEAFKDLLNAISSGESPDDIPNIVTKNNKNRVTVRSLVDDIDTLPFPDYALIYDNTPMGKYPLKSFITSRGCPYDCTYCFNHAWRKIYSGKGKIVRRHSVNYVIDELQYVKGKWPLSFVKFYDDTFTYSADSWLEEFSSKYKKHINLPFFILTRADLLSEDIVKFLKTAGCHTISMSIESGNAGIREKMLKRSMTDKQIVDAHRLCDRYGIYTFTNCIIGLPGTTVENDIESVELAINSKVAWAEFLIFHPYPGTELTEKTIEMGFYKPDYKRMHTSYMYASPLKCFNNKEINIHKNLSVLGAVAIAFPYFKNLIVRHLIYIKHNYFFTFIYYFTKMYIFRKKIYVTKTNFFVSVCIFVKSLKQEWFRHEDKKG